MEYHITAERLDELKKELEHLKTAKRIEISDRLKKAKELGDLSENAEYAEARDEQERIEKRILDLEDIVLNAQVIKKSSDKSFVDIGSTVEVARDLATQTGGKTMKFFITGSNETRPELGQISNESPLGKALLNRKAGDTVTVETPDGRKVNYKIIKIS